MDEKILVVDDDEVLSRVLRRVLSHDGYTVLTAATVAQAIQLDQEQRPRLALIDLCLPDGDGVQLADALWARHPDLGLILMTAYPIRLQENRAAVQRFTHVLTKPLNVHELRQTFEASLSLARAAVANPSPGPASRTRGVRMSPTPTRRVREAAGPPLSRPCEAPASSFFRIGQTGASFRRQGNRPVVRV